MRFYVGTSGFSYPKWKANFYPKTLKLAEFLQFYGERFDTVEINSSSRQLPATGAVARWIEQTPASFRFVLKAQQAITHRKRLVDCEGEVAALLKSVSLLKRRAGPILFQLPPNFKQDLSRLAAFLKLLPRRVRAAFEFRHESWLDEETFALLRKHRAALCAADAEELPATPIVATADWGYFRLRREKYTPAQLRMWIRRIREQPWKEAFVFFKHEDTGTGPKFGARFLKLAAE